MTTLMYPKPELGAEFETTACAWSPENQALTHKWSGIEGSDPNADPVLLALGGIYQIGEAIRTHMPQMGPVITRQVLTINRLQPVGAPAFVNGRVSTFDDVPRGTMMISDFEITDECDQNLVDLSVAILLIDPEKMAKAQAERGPQKRSPRPPTEEIIPLAILGQFACTPDTTRGYEIENIANIHSDEEIAAAAGFPKPIVSGNQIFGIIWDRFVKSQYQLPVTLEFKLGRPIFWDEEVTFVSIPATDGEDLNIETRNSNQKVSITGKVRGRRMA